ncbi:MAG: AAA family ATPase, partial [Candidatus Hydrothermarchaeaceae archaeon]
VLDGTFYKRSLRGQIYDISKRTGAKLAVIECRAPEENIKRRTGRRTKRKNQASDADYEIYKKIKTEFEPIRRKHLALDTSKSRQNTLEEVLRYLETF